MIKYGKSKFSFHANLNDTRSLEKYYIDKFKPEYNIC